MRRVIHTASRERRFSRWLHHPAIHPQEWYAPVLQKALSDWPRSAPLYIALDTTALTPFVLIRASLIYRGRAISLAWRAMRHRSTKVGFEDSTARPLHVGCSRSPSPVLRGKRHPGRWSQQPLAAAPARQG